MPQHSGSRVLAGSSGALPRRRLALLLLCLLCGLALACRKEVEPQRRDSILQRLELADNPLLSHLELYGEPSLHTDGEGVTISGDGPAPAGLFLRFELDPAQRYLLQIEGRSLADSPATLRLRQDRDVRHYRRADRDVDLVVDRTSELEVLLYGDQRFSHRLEAVRIEGCSGCRTDVDLRELILAEVPELTTGSTAPLESALLLLDWSSRVTDMTFTPALLRSGLSKIPASQIYYEYFEKDQGGVYCGGASIFLDKVLRLFGHESFTINFGVPDGATHVAVILPVRQGEQWRYYLLDPTYNATFHERETGRLVGVSEMLDWAADKGPQVAIRGRSLAERDFLLLPTEGHKCPLLREERPDLLVCSFPNYDMATSFADQSFAARGYPEDPLTAYVQLLRARVFSVGASPEASATRGFLRILRTHDIPYGNP